MTNPGEEIATSFDRPTEVSDVTLAFPANALDLMPAMEDIPTDYPHRDEWETFASTWFATGLSRVYTGMVPQEGVDPNLAIRHLSAILGSFASKHEHKLATIGWLLSRWFVWACYHPEGGKAPVDKSQHSRIRWIGDDLPDEETRDWWLTEQEKQEEEESEEEGPQ